MPASDRFVMPIVGFSLRVARLLARKFRNPLATERRTVVLSEGSRARSKAAGLRPAPVGVRGFESLPSHTDATPFVIAPLHRLMAEDVELARQALSRHDGFNTDTDPIAYQQTPFAVTTTVGETTVIVEAELPTLNAVVTDTDVGPAVANGWYETLTLRLADIAPATKWDATDIETRVERTDECVRAVYQFPLRYPRRAGEDVAAIAQFVEGTYLQGVIPGYEYDDPVAGLLARASDQAGSDDVDPTRGGTPL